MDKIMSLNEINLLYGQNRGLRIQNEELQRENIQLRQEIMELKRKCSINT